MSTRIQATLQIIVAELLTFGAILRVIGWMGRVVYGPRLSAVTLFYPANRSYLEKMTFSWYAPRVKWRPVFGGVYATEKGGGYIFFASALEEEITNPDNIKLLLSLEAHMQEMAAKLGVKTVAYSGVIPSFLARAGVIRDPIELTRTAHWVVEAMGAVKRICHLTDKNPIIILGAAGHLGRRVTEIIRQQMPNEMIVEIDPAHNNNNCATEQKLTQLSGQAALIINISRQDALDGYIDLLWPNAIILDEVYPECSPAMLKKLKHKGVRYFHIQGVEGFTLPKLPGSYNGAVPCCAASAANTEAGQWATNVMVHEK